MGQKQSNRNSSIASGASSSTRRASTTTAKPQKRLHAKFSWKDPQQQHNNIALVASFNSWEPQPLKYHPSKQEWSLIVTVPIGMHLYRYIVDGEYKFDSSRKYIVDKDGKCSNFVSFHEKDYFPKQSPQHKNLQQDVSSRSRSRSGPPKPNRTYDKNSSSNDTRKRNRSNSVTKRSKSHERMRPSDPENPLQNVWGQEEYEFPVKRKYPPLLPPHTSYTLLNIQPDDELTPSPSYSTQTMSHSYPASQLSQPQPQSYRWNDLEPLHVTLNHIYFVRNDVDSSPDMIQMGVSTKYRGKSTTVHIFKSAK